MRSTHRHPHAKMARAHAGRTLLGNIQLLDSVPILGVFALIVLVTLVFYEIGFRIGRWWQVRTPGEQATTGVLVGSLVALMAFLLAVTMGMAADRFNGRRSLVLDEANSIGTTYLRAGYLPEPQSSEVRELLREYAPLRVSSADRAEVQANIDRSVVLQNHIWAIAEDLARTTTNGPLTALFIETTNEMIDIHESRVIASIYGRVPETILLLLLGGSALTLGMVGYSAGLSLQRGIVSAIVLTIALSAVLTLVVDLDRPREGFVQVSQQPILDVIQSIGSPSP